MIYTIFEFRETIRGAIIVIQISWIQNMSFHYSGITRKHLNTQRRCIREMDRNG